MELEYIIRNNGELNLENYIYSGGTLEIDLDLTELDKKITIKIKTNNLSFNNYYIDKKEELYKTCRIEIKELVNNLSIENGIYIPSSNFGKLMNETRSNYNLAYGKKSTELKFIFSLVGYDNLISCLLTDLNKITITENT